MAKLEVWEELVKQYGGAVVAWINQAEAVNLKAVNSQGVCNAIFRDWLASYRTDQHARQSFVARFAGRDSKGNWLNANVPQDYIAAQQKLSEAEKLQRAGLALRTRRREMAEQFAAMQKELDAPESGRDVHSDALDPVGENESKSEKDSKSEEDVT